MTNSKKDSRPNQYTFPDGTIVDFGNRNPQKCLDDYVKWLDKKRSKPVDSKKDSELEELLTALCDKVTYGVSMNGKAGYTRTDIVAEALQAINFKYITKEESDRRVLEARIEEVTILRDSAKRAGDPRSTVELNTIVRAGNERIAELRELLKGGKQ